MGVCRHELGVQPPTPDNSNPASIHPSIHPYNHTTAELGQDGIMNYMLLVNVKGLSSLNSKPPLQIFWMTMVGSNNK